MSTATVTATVPPSQQPTHMTNGRSHRRTDSEAMNTIPDPRSSPSPVTPSSGDVSRNGSDASGPATEHHPDLSNEVAMLSNKLINAINHQTTLDDNLQASRHQLESALEHIKQLESVNKEYSRKMEEGLLIEKDEVEGWKVELDEQRKKCETAEREKKSMETELENLTSALFEEANTMVAAARRETQETERKNDQLKSQLRDTEELLASQQEQLQDLKVVMEKMSERDENETNTHQSTAPSTPGLATHDKMSRIFESSISPAQAGPDDVVPNHPLHFGHLVHPILRNDLQAYNDFKDLLKISKSATPSRAGSGNYGGLNIMGLGVSHANASSSSLSNIVTSPVTPGGPTNFSTAASPSMSSPSFNNLPPLKDTKFYKRAVTEDIDPTLRLDAAPGLSWLARRSIVSSMAAGNLVVEPFAPVSKFYGPIFACSLCGENRKSDKYARRHRFRVSESDGADRYPLCEYCLGRVRTSCDYMGFLRMVKDGHWRAETDEEVWSAYEESVRLRERMFWARLGGGVVPSLCIREIPRSPSLPVPPRRSSDEVGLSVSKTRDDPFSNRQKEDEKAMIAAMTTIEAPPATSPSEPDKSDSNSSKSLSRSSSLNDEAAAQQLNDEATKAMPPPPAPASKSESPSQEKPTPASPPRHRSTGSNGIVARALAKFDSSSEKPAGPIKTPSEERLEERETQRVSANIPGSFE